MDKLLKNIYLIKCAIFLAIGVIAFYNDLHKFSALAFALAFLYPIFHLDTMINDKKDNNG